MNPFIYLPSFCAIVCIGLECKYAVLPIYVDSHLSHPRYNYNREQREQVVREIGQIDGLIQDARGLESFEFPKLSSLAIPKLRVAKEGLQCIQCKYICCNKVKMQDHCKVLHNWRNERKKGKPLYKKRHIELELL